MLFRVAVLCVGWVFGAGSGFDYLGKLQNEGVSYRGTSAAKERAQVTALAHLPGGTQVVFGDYKGAVSLFDLTQRKVLWSKPIHGSGNLPGAPSHVQSVAVSLTGQYLFSRGVDRSLKVVRASDGEVVASEQVGDLVPWSEVVSATGAPRIALTAGPTKGDVLILDYEETPEFAFIERYSVQAPDVKWLTSMAISADGARLVTGEWSSNPQTPGIARLWEVETGKELLAIVAYNDRDVNAVALAPQGDRIATAGYVLDAEIRVWDVGSGKKVGASAPYSSHAGSLQFTPDGKYILAIGKERDAESVTNGSFFRVLDGTTAALLRSEKPMRIGLPRWNLASTALSLSADGKSIALGFSDDSREADVGIAPQLYFADFPALP